MKAFIVDRLAPYILSRRFFARVNKVLFTIGLHGMGVGNWRDQRSERLFLKRLARILSQEAMILDVGANVGDYARMVRRYFPNARLLAFEPHPGNFQRLARVAAADGFEAINVACGEKPGTDTLYDYAETQGSRHASLFRDAIEEVHHARSKGRSQAIDIEVVTLDSILRQRNIGIVDFLKIDVEGYEMSVLRGAEEFVANGRIRVIQFEFTELNIYSKLFFRDFKQFLENYKIYRILYDGSLLDVTDSLPLYVELFFYQNLVAIHLNNLSALEEICT